MKQTQNQYFGLLSELPANLSPGSSFLSIDDHQIFLYGTNSKPHLHELHNALDNRITIKSASDFGIIDSNKEYFLDGIIDMGTNSIEVPAGGITINGYSFDLSGLTSSEDNFSLFTSPAGGSGNILFKDFLIDIDGSNSQVYDVVSDTGFNAIEVARINFNNCSSLGTIDGYRQGLEVGTGRFGGKPELTLKGNWVGGYFIDTSIVRSLVNGSYSLYKAGVGFVMNSRFRSNQNIDLPASVSFIDFNTSNFVTSSTLQLENCLITRNGVLNSSDTNIIPNVSASDLVSKWKNNNGIKNTFVGANKKVSAEIETTITVDGQFEDLNGTFVAGDLQHFDSLSGGQLRYIGDSPIEFKVSGQFVLAGTADDVVALKLVVNRDGGADEDVSTISRVIDRLQGVRNVGYFVGISNVTLNKNDHIRFQIANIGDTNNITAEVDSFFIAEER